MDASRSSEQLEPSTAVEHRASSEENSQDNTNVAVTDNRKPSTKLGQWSATAICGNDITSSCLYVAALCILSAGYLAPISLIVVVLVLYLYRKIYAEVGDALPLNGGAYNCLLNSTTKFWASIAACMTIVSYIATAVISAKTAVSYIAYVSGFEHNVPLILGITIGVLALFAMVTIIGIGESSRIIIAFFLLSSSILLLTGGRVDTLAGLYAIAFLGVMSLFAIGNILLKLRRSRLKRRYRASTIVVLVALIATVTGLLGNIIKDVDRFWFFLTYFVPTVVVVGIMFWRIRILRLFLYVVRSVVTNIDGISERITKRTGEMIEEINSTGAVFFTRGDNVANLNLAVLYVLANEETNILKFVHVFQEETKIDALVESLLLPQRAVLDNGAAG